MYRILVVDDEPMIRKGLEKLILQADPAITHSETAENGVEALNKIAEHRPDFLFTDIKMPKMDGLELCRHVYEQYKHMIQIVVISGYEDFEYAQKCLRYGVKEYILKPVNKAGINQTVQKLIANVAELHQRTLIPSSKLDQWLLDLDDSIWHLRMDDILATIDKMEAYLQGGTIEPHQLKELLHELFISLINKLNQRDVYVFDAQEMMAELSLQDMPSFEWFRQVIESTMQFIRVKRKGNIRDPVEEAKEYIRRNISKEVSLEEVSNLLGLNPSYFSQMFKHSTDETFVQYRIRLRMEKAKKLLAIPHYKITDISYEVGYADHPHFTKTFKRYTGNTPSEYRNKLGIE